jgi:hypothetical protein
MSILFGSKDLSEFQTTLKTDDSNFEPWDVLITFTSETAYEYRLIPSTVNQVAPNNYVTVETGSISSEKYISLSVTTTAGRVTSVSIVAEQAEAPPVLLALPPSSFKIGLGIIGTNGIYYKFVQGKPISVEVITSFSIDRVPPVPGLSNTIPYYTWRISQP